MWYDINYIFLGSNILSNHSTPRLSIITKFKCTSFALGLNPQEFVSIRILRSNVSNSKKKNVQNSTAFSTFRALKYKSPNPLSVWDKNIRLIIPLALIVLISKLIHRTHNTLSLKFMPLTLCLWGIIILPKIRNIGSIYGQILTKFRIKTYRGWNESKILEVTLKIYRHGI